MWSVLNSLILWIWITDGNIYLFVLLVVVFQIPVHLFLAIGLLIHATPIPCVLTIISPQKRIVLNSLLQPTFPVCGLSFQTQSGIVLYYIASHLLKNIFKVTLLKLVICWAGARLLIFILQFKYSASVHPDPFNMSAWSVFEWVGWVGWWVGVIFFFFFFFFFWFVGLGLGVLQHAEMVF